MVDATSSSHTVYFDKPLVAPRFVSLISATIPSSWHNLKSLGWLLSKKDGNSRWGKDLPPGHYMLETLANALVESFDDRLRLLSYSYAPSGALLIETTDNTDCVEVERELADLLGITDRTITRLVVPRLNSPDTFYIHSDIIA